VKNKPQQIAEVDKLKILLNIYKPT